jgi:predicted small lipoprotein YifL
MFRRTIRRFWVLLALISLAGCGDAAGPAALAPSQSPATPAPQAPTATASPVATRPAPTAVAAQPTALASADQTAAPSAADRDIPESVTAEGYHVLGRADAPVTLTMYSDFL